MDQDTTKDGPDSADRRNWRERLGEGKELPKISQEFESAEANHAGQQPEAQGVQGERTEPRLGMATPKSPPQGTDQPRPRTPVARPAPMAPRAPRRAAPSGETGGTPESPTSTTTDHGPSSISLSLKPSSAPAQQGLKPGDAASAKYVSRPSWPASSRPESGSSPTPHPSFPRVSPSSGQSQSSTRAPAVGNDAFSERLRAQREAAERLAQQRLAAARQRSGQAKTAAEQRPQRPSAAGPAAAHPTAKPLSHAASAEMPRFTFAEEEIAAAQRETAPQEGPTPGGGHGQPHVPPPYTPPHERAAAAEAYEQAEPPIAAPGPDADDERGGSDPGLAEPAEPYQVRPRDYDDEGMFEAEHADARVPPRASAADYTAAYREFEDEFEDDTPPRRGGGPLILLLSLLAVAMIGGGLIYWYQQSQGTVEPQAGDVPVITAPSEPVKATPEPEEQPQEAAVAPTRRKQIYDRILGEETLEPERIVPTEEQPQFRQIQEPRGELGTPAADPEQGFGTDEQNDSTDPRPLPLPPPPGTGQQGDLLLPEPEPVTAAATPVRGPVMAGRLDRERGDALIAPVAQSPRTAAAEPDRLEARIAARPDGSALQRSARDDTGQSEPGAAEAASIPSDAATEATSSAVAAVSSDSEPATQSAGDAAVATAVNDPVSPPASEAVSEADEAEAPAPAEGTEVAAVSDASEEHVSAPPVPRTKPEPPVRSARTSEPKPQPQPQAPRQSSGPVQITPTLLAPESTSRASVLPQTQAPAPQPSRPARMGRESDPLEGKRTANYASHGSSTQRLASEPSRSEPQPAPQQQVASVEPQPAPSQAETGSDYVVQLAAFRSEAEAQSEFQRLAQSHPQLVGKLDPRIQQASLGQGGSFYRLGIGPLGDRNAATKLCNALIAAGEKDCLVRRR